MLTLLGQTPHRLSSETRRYDNAQLQNQPAPDGWSANEILAHLRACADVWGKSILRMIIEDQPTIRYVSPRTRVRKTNYAELDFDIPLTAFSA